MHNTYIYNPYDISIEILYVISFSGNNTWNLVELRQWNLTLECFKDTKITKS